MTKIEFHEFEINRLKNALKKIIAVKHTANVLLGYTQFYKESDKISNMTDIVRELSRLAEDVDTEIKKLLEENGIEPDSEYYTPEQDYE